MKMYRLALAGLTACAVTTTPVVVFAQHEEQARIAAAQSHPEVRAVIQELQRARYELSRADRTFFTERGDARQQVDFALTQLFAVVGDREWEQKDKELWERQKRAGEQAWDERQQHVDQQPASADRPHFRMQNALERLESAKTQLEAIGGDLGGRKAKTITFIDEAHKAINIGVDKARKEARAELGDAEDRAQPAAAQEHPELRAAIEELQAARHHLSFADRRFATERGDASKQVQFALTQLFAAVGDRQWEQQDQRLAEHEQRRGEAQWKEREEMVRQTPATADQPFMRMQNALDELQTARERLDGLGAGYGGRKAKAVEFITEAEKAIRAGMEKARAQGREAVAN